MFALPSALLLVSAALSSLAGAPTLERCSSMYYAPHSSAQELKVDLIQDQFCSQYPATCMVLPDDEDWGLGTDCQPFEGTIRPSLDPKDLSPIAA